MIRWQMEYNGCFPDSTSAALGDSLDHLPMKPPISKVSAIDQATNHLRERVIAGEWKTLIPGERPLSDQLGISRPTLREALKILQQEGLISCEPNHSRRVLTKVRRRTQAVRRVTFLTGPDLTFQETADQILRAGLTALLQKQDIRTDQIAHPSLERDSANKTLEAIVRRNPHHGWTLFSVSRKVQKWFWENHIPAIVIGSTYPDIQLPSFDIDNRAVCRHAAGTLISLRHKRIALILPAQPRAGDLESQIGFTEAFQQSPVEGLEPQIIFTRRNPDDLRQKLRAALHSDKSPTGLVVCHANLALTALTFCQSIGRRIPRDISIISRDSEAYMDFVSPRISRYVRTDAAFTRKLFSLLLKIVSGSELPPKKHFVTPTFEAAGSIGPPPR